MKLLLGVIRQSLTLRHAEPAQGASLYTGAPHANVLVKRAACTSEDVCSKDLRTPLTNR